MSIQFAKADSSVFSVDGTVHNIRIVLQDLFVVCVLFNFDQTPNSVRDYGNL